MRAMVKISLHSGDKPLSVKKMTEDEDISPIFLEQILTKLKKLGLVKSIRGAAGGFFLGRDSREISVRDILEAVEESVQLAPCCCADEELAAVDCVHIPDCKISRFWNDANTQIQELFDSYSLERIIQEYGLV